MNRALVPIFLIIVSIAGFFMWINPHYANVQALNAELKQSQDALAQAQQLDTVKNSLMAKKDSFNADDLDKLQKMLPDNVDNIRLFLDLQGVASHYNTSITDIAAGDTGQQKASTSAQPIGPSDKQYNQMALSFSIAISYEDLILFLKDLEKSLRIVEIKSISFAADNANPDHYKVSVSINASWLNSKTSAVTSS